MENSKINKSAGNAIEVSEVSKIFNTGVQEVQVLKNVTFNVKLGDFVIIFGPSGSGKSTILHTLLGLEPPTSGRVRFLGESLYENGDEDYRSEFRKQHIGMVYQQPNWVKSLTVKENVAFPLLLRGSDQNECYDKAMDILKTVELDEWAEYRPTELSGGQQQRVALARALVNSPQVLIADEPTGNLDYENGQRIMQLFYDLNHKQDITVIMVTHDLEYLPYSNTAVHIFDGTVDGVYEGENKKNLLSKVRFKRGASPSAGSGNTAPPEPVTVTQEPTQKQEELTASMKPVPNTDPSTSVTPTKFGEEKLEPGTGHVELSTTEVKKEGSTPFGNQESVLLPKTIALQVPEKANKKSRLLKIFSKK